MKGGRVKALGFPICKAVSCRAASSRSAARELAGMTKAGSMRSGAVVMQTRSRMSRHDKIRCWASPSSNAASVSVCGGSNSAMCSIPPSIRMVVARRSGDQCAGAAAGGASGRAGKAQAPSPGQALPFVLGARWLLGDPAFGRAMIVAIAFVATQVLLREIRVIVRRKVGGGRTRPPSRSARHKLSVATAQTGQGSTV